MEQNTVILSIERYDELKKFEKVVENDSETMFYHCWDGQIRDVKLYNDSVTHNELMDLNNSLVIENKRLKKLVSDKSIEIRGLKNEISALKKKNGTH